MYRCMVDRGCQQVLANISLQLLGELSLQAQLPVHIESRWQLLMYNMHIYGNEGVCICVCVCVFGIRKHAHTGISDMLEHPAWYRIMEVGNSRPWAACVYVFSGPSLANRWHKHHRYSPNFFTFIVWMTSDMHVCVITSTVRAVTIVELSVGSFWCFL